MLAVDLEPDANGPGVPFAADLTTRDGNRAAVERAVAVFGGLDTIVANAGFQQVLERVILAPHAIKRLIEPDVVAQAVMFLLGPAGWAFTGAPFVMDAGWTAR